ncbi:DUF397 domain-containing protein [Streptomyces genisteinicus]|uniref:DUF397 domain-containing protein n=1 Tax=Streptomyces genisteinicus TaxID=2768068 RepID=A0A7H0HU21_9ACTN|nr:DUF397 domain-containing protein [Streptomyces genisteinicus]QNP64037.1 DUF397 domain-containing protein [Streptomyces genisteinicus]
MTASASTWQKSSYCGEGESCVHVSRPHGTIEIAESSEPKGFTIRTTPAAFTTLVDAIKQDGRFRRAA